MILLNKKPLLIASLLLSLFAVQLLGTQEASAAYDGGRIIDNSVFLDAKSMSINDVQNFLSSKGGQIATRSFVLNCDAAGSQAKQAYLSQGAPCGQSVPASHTIYYAAQVYGISPKVILATLQKEQSLVTAVNPTDRQYSQAMGYACPTSGSCSDSSNFFWQVDNGVWVLRFHMERARGNNTWWYSSSSWTCGIEKNFYKPNLYPNQNVNFYDEDGVMYRTHYIVNAATSSMYCYTPHAYNNPQGLYGRAPYGTTGRYYSGSYNFVLFFENWFGSTQVPEYRAQAAEQSPGPYLKQGESASMYVRFKNTGNQTWYDDTSAYAVGSKPVRIATDLPLNHSSPFAYGWQYNHRPGINFARVYDENGSIKPGEHTAKPGESVEFWFAYKAPHNIAPGTYFEGFRPIVEGLGPMNDTGTYFVINVAPAIHSASFYDQSSFPSVTQYQKATAFIRYKNTGNVAWYDDTSVVGSGQLAVQLATDYPLNRASSFSSFWPYKHRASLNFAAVYESNGTTLAANQHIAQPGQIVKFSFDMMATASTNPGFYGESLRPIVQGKGPMNDTGTWMGINVSRAIYTASFASQSAFPEIQRGQNTEVYIQYKNTGNVAWYDDFTAWPAKVAPVKLGTDYPLNRSSVFGSSWLAPHRPGANFAAVYESNGTTLAANQHIAQPGQIVKFSFRLSPTQSQSTGFYGEPFRPIVEGLGPMNDTGTWMGLTVK